MSIECRIVVLNDNGCPVRTAQFDTLPDRGDLVMITRVDGMSGAACVVKHRAFYQRSILLLVEHDEAAEEDLFRAIDLMIRDNISGDDL